MPLSACRLLRLIAALAATLVLARTAAAATPEASDLKLIDLTGEFAAEYDRTAGLPDAERVAAFKAHFGPIVPGFYSAGRFRLNDPAKYDARLLRSLQRFPEERAGIAEVSRRFSALFAPAVASFEARFGSLKGYPPVYLVHSLGEFDGGTRSLPNGTFLFFGADMIARLHAHHDIQPFFHHELFHLIHAKNFPECDTVWCGLWTEGLAVYVAAQLNPKATDEDLLLTFPEPLRPAVERNRAAAVCAVLAHLDSTDPMITGAMFSSERMAPELPPRFAYYVGYLVASELGRTRDLKELAALKPDQIRPMLGPTLRRLATCP